MAIIRTIRVVGWDYEAETPLPTDFIEWLKGQYVRFRIGIARVLCANPFVRGGILPKIIDQELKCQLQGEQDLNVLMVKEHGVDARRILESLPTQLFDAVFIETPTVTYRYKV